jgi:hypothetical protein
MRVSLTRRPRGCNQVEMGKSRVADEDSSESSSEDDSSDCSDHQCTAPVVLELRFFGYGLDGNGVVF